MLPFQAPDLCLTKITESECALGADEKVLRLNIPVHVAPTMEIVQGLEDLKSVDRHKN